VDEFDVAFFSGQKCSAIVDREKGFSVLPKPLCQKKQIRIQRKAAAESLSFAIHKRQQYS
jgi:hypothetical protein|tara:strand:- start:3646 stop:3825 length:180 start_codon:yes stop_codon:yes gene_type:complete